MVSEKEIRKWKKLMIGFVLVVDGMRTGHFIVNVADSLLVVVIVMNVICQSRSLGSKVSGMLIWKK